MIITRLETPLEVDEVLSRSSGEQVLLFFGTERPETGASWCGDCVIAHPVIRATLSAIRSREVTLHECPVGDRQAYKDVADHAYRVDPRVRLARIPTFLRIVDGQEIGRLVEAECSDPDRLLELMARADPR